MGKHHSADEKLISRSLRKNKRMPDSSHPAPNLAPQIPPPNTNSKNQYR